MIVLDSSYVVQKASFMIDSLSLPPAMEFLGGRK